MTSIQTPAEELEDVRRELKAWENTFKHHNGRKPTSDDVDVGSEEIRELYVKYKRLKRKIQDKKAQSSENVGETKDRDYTVFGQAFNNKKLVDHKREEELIHERNMKEARESLMRKRFRRWTRDGGHATVSLSDGGTKGGLKSKNDDLMGGLPRAESNDETNAPTKTEFPIICAGSALWSGLGSAALKRKRRFNLEADWLDECQPEGARATRLRADSAECLGYDDWEEERKQSVDARLDDVIRIEVSKDEAAMTSSPLRCRDDEPEDRHRVTESTTGSSLNLIRTESDCKGSNDTNHDTKKEREQLVDTPDSDVIAVESSRDEVDHSTSATAQASQCHDDIKDGCRVTGDYLECGENETEAVCQDVSALDSNLESALAKFYEDDPDDGDDCANASPVDSSLSLWNNLAPGAKRRHVSESENASAAKSGGNSAKSRKKSKRETAAAPSKPKPGSSRGLVSENFVRIDMNRRRFYRPKGGIGSAAKRFSRWAWKRKFKAKFGQTKTSCFQCGQDGHWASKCPQRTEQRVEGESDAEWDGTEIMDLPTSPSRPPDYDLSPSTESVEPVYSETCHDTPQEVFDTLQKLGFSSFRSGQEKAVMRTLQGLSTIVVMPTGSGKSLCYQLPACLYAKHRNSVTLVISPLVSLMEDQIQCLPFGLRGACIHSGLQPKQKQKTLSDVADGRISILLLSPESLISGKDSLKLPPISFACIDEVHCISEWSHNFRPCYLQLCQVLRETYGVSCILGLTATATSSTLDSVSKHLNLPKNSDAIIRGPPLPTNLCLSVSCDRNRDRALIDLLQGKRFDSFDSIIIYCTRQQETERLAQYIRTSHQDRSARGSRSTSAAEAYHAGLTAAERRRVQKRFTSGSVRIVVATVAFGMGINKANVGGIVHYNMPKTLESYVQEIGRAGRDGSVAHCHVFLDEDGFDIGELKRHCFAHDVDRYTVKRFVNRVFPHCRCSELTGGSEGGPTACGPGHEVAIDIEKNVFDLDLKEEALATLLCYLELRGDGSLRQLAPSYSRCTIKCYGGGKQMRALASKCLAVNAALALCREQCQNVEKTSIIQFNLIELCNRMGWESRLVRRELNGLEWDTSGKVPQKTGVMVEFGNLALRARCSGSLSGDERDEICDYLFERVKNQVTMGLNKLRAAHSFLLAVAHESVRDCVDDVKSDLSDALRKSIELYFSDDVAALEKSDSSSSSSSSSSQCTKDDEVGIRRDVRGLVSLHEDQTFSGHAVARIFQGIASPRYAAEVWGRNRRFWRRHIAVDFNVLRKIATEEIVKMR